MKIFNIISSNSSIHGDISSTAKLFFVICCEDEARETPMLFVYILKPLGTLNGPPRKNRFAEQISCKPCVCTNSHQFHKVVSATENLT